MANVKLTYITVPYRAVFFLWQSFVHPNFSFRIYFLCLMEHALFFIICRLGLDSVQDNVPAGDFLAYFLCQTSTELANPISYVSASFLFVNAHSSKQDWRVGNYWHFTYVFIIEQLSCLNCKHWRCKKYATIWPSYLTVQILVKLFWR